MNGQLSVEDIKSTLRKVKSLRCKELGEEPLAQLKIVTQYIISCNLPDNAEHRGMAFVNIIKDLIQEGIKENNGDKITDKIASKDFTLLNTLILQRRPCSTVAKELFISQRTLHRHYTRACQRLASKIMDKEQAANTQ